MTSLKKWNEIKQELKERKIEFFYNEREIWWCYVGFNIGFEENGGHQSFERPVLILKKISKELFWAIPLTTKPGKKIYRLNIGKINNKDSYALFEQIRVFSTKRLKRKLSILKRKFFLEIKIILINKISS